MAPTESGDSSQPLRDPKSLLDPKRPVMQALLEQAGVGRSVARHNQRQRRSVILAAIRKLLIEDGYKGVTLRRIASVSGHVVQTVYNLVGPRDHAIVEAIDDYTVFVGSLVPPDSDDPAAMIKSIEWQAQSVMEMPEFTRQVCMIYFTDDRHIFYNYRDRQIRNVQTLLARQKRSGVLRRDVNCRDLARDLMTLSGAIFIDWADGVLPETGLLPRLTSGYGNLLAGAISPRFGGMAAEPF